MRRLFALLGMVLAAIAFAVIVLWAVLQVPARRELGGGLSAFDTIDEWQVWFIRWATALLVLVTLLRRWRPIYLGVVVAVSIAALYWPFFYVTRTRFHRVRGPYSESMADLRNLAVMVVVSIALALLYAVAARRDPLHALLPLLVLCVVLCPIYWVPMFTPWSATWMPAEWERPDRIIAFQPCRGALLWHVGYGPNPVLRIDEIWERFADPRGGVTRAISAEGEWREGYYWLTDEEAKQLFVRSDDPKVMHCDSRSRAEPVRPASWHKLGLSE